MATSDCVAHDLDAAGLYPVSIGAFTAEQTGQAQQAKQSPVVETVVVFVPGRSLLACRLCTNGR